MGSIPTGHPMENSIMEKPKWPDGPELIEESDTGKEGIFKRLLEWIEKASKNQPPSCGGGCCK